MYMSRLDRRSASRGRALSRRRVGIREDVENQISSSSPIHMLTNQSNEYAQIVQAPEVANQESMSWIEEEEKAPNIPGCLLTGQHHRPQDEDYFESENELSFIALPADESLPMQSNSGASDVPANDIQLMQHIKDQGLHDYMTERNSAVGIDVGLYREQQAVLQREREMNEAVDMFMERASVDPNIIINDDQHIGHFNRDVYHRFKEYFKDRNSLIKDNETHLSDLKSVLNVSVHMKTPTPLYVLKEGVVDGKMYRFLVKNTGQFIGTNMPVLEGPAVLNGIGHCQPIKSASQVNDINSALCSNLVNQAEYGLGVDGPDEGCISIDEGCAQLTKIFLRTPYIKLIRRVSQKYQRRVGQFTNNFAKLNRGDMLGLKTSLEILSKHTDIEVNGVVMEQRYLVFGNTMKSVVDAFKMITNGLAEIDVDDISMDDVASLYSTNFLYAMDTVKDVAALLVLINNHDKAAIERELEFSFRNNAVRLLIAVGQLGFAIEKFKLDLVAFNNKPDVNEDDMFNICKFDRLEEHIRDVTIITDTFDEQ